MSPHSLNPIAGSFSNDMCYENDILNLGQKFHMRSINEWMLSSKSYHPLILTAHMGNFDLYIFRYYGTDLLLLVNTVMMLTAQGPDCNVSLSFTLFGSCFCCTIDTLIIVVAGMIVGSGWKNVDGKYLQLSRFSSIHMCGV